MAALCLPPPSTAAATSVSLFRKNLTLISHFPISKLKTTRRCVHYARHLSPLLRLSSSRLAAGAIVDATAASVDELVEKDWSFLDSIPCSSFPRIVSAGQLAPASKILVATPAPSFIDSLMEASTYETVVAVHESLFVLARIKEGHDSVRCFHGPGLTPVPDRFAPFDVVFVSYFPAMGIAIGELLRLLSRSCSKGARVVIGFGQGRETVEQHHRIQCPDIVLSTMPRKADLEKAADDTSYEITEFVDEPEFYIAVLAFNG